MFRDRVRALLALAPALLTLIACAPSAGIAVDPADGGTDAGACPGGSMFPFCDQGRVTLGCCPAGARCSPPASYCDLGNGACVLGTSCPADAGPDAGRDANADADAGPCPGGSMFPFCDQGQVSLECCPAGANCSPPASYCDFGDGKCLVGTCPADAGPDAVVEP